MTIRPAVRSDAADVAALLAAQREHLAPWDPRREPVFFTRGGQRSRLAQVERDRAAFLDALRARDVLMVEYPNGQVRAVTHHGVTADDIDTVLAATEAALAATGRASEPPVAVGA